MPRLAAAFPALALALLLPAAPAAAQPAMAGGNLPIDPFRPAIDSRGYLTINASQPLGHGDVSFGLGALAWGRGLLALEDGGHRYTVDDVITATQIAAVGVRVGPAELELGASLPLSILSGDRGPDDLGAPGDPNDDRDFRLDGQGLGNIGLHLKTRFVKASRAPVGVGAIASVFLPTARPADRFLGDAAIVPQLIGIVDKELARGRLRVALNGGIRLRSTTTFTDAGEMGSPPTHQTVTASAELPVGLGVAWAVAPRRFELIGEIFGAIPLGAHERYQPLEALGGVKLYLARSSFLSLGAGRGLARGDGASPDARAFIGLVFEPSLGDRDGAQLPDAEQPREAGGLSPRGPSDRDGDGIVDELDRCPDDPEDFDQFEDEDGCPDLDNDGDRILDVDDLCPDAPEDDDGWEDEDGCPDLDNDGDRIPDRDDRCPNEREEYNNVDDEDGCPDHGTVIRTGGEFQILEPINFEYNSAVIQADSFPILDAVVAALQGNPDVELVEVAGHTDQRGDDAYNLELSDRRAAAVVAYLVRKKVDPKRLESQGYGETRPIDPRNTPRAWAKNRRVEFLILRPRR
ncbi:MAG: OmpA family protein [Kofleriaceae bacterium]